MNSKIRVLIVEDSESDAELVVRQLRRAFLNPQWVRVDTPWEMEASLKKISWDLIIADYNLPEFKAPDALRILHATGQDIPFIVVSGSIGEDAAVAMMKAGAHDYLMKDNLARLGPAVEREIQECRVRQERRIAEEQVRASLQEKEILLKEIHHRVKNNMQVVVSMLNMQAQEVSDPVVYAQFQEAQDRIRSIALVHEKLYRSEDFAGIDFAEYLEDVTSTLFDSYNTGNAMLELEAEKVHLGIDAAVPCGLIVNELVSNALKHAFPGASGGTVTVSMRKDTDGVIVLTVRDNGIGIPDTLDFTKTGTLGMSIVSVLVQQINGEMVIEGSGGTCVTVTFANQVAENQSVMQM